MSKEVEHTQEELFVEDEETPLQCLSEDADWFAAFHPRYRRAYEIVNHKEYHKNATYRHVDLARLVFQFTGDSKDWSQNAFEKWLPSQPLNDSNWIGWTKFVHEKVIEDPWNFEAYMMK